MADEPKKNIFNAAIDALTNRDEKAAAEAAQKQAQAAQQQAEAARQQAETARLEAEAAKAELEKVKAEAEAAQKNAADLRGQMSDMQMMAQAEKAHQEFLANQARQVEEAQNAAAAASAAESVANAAAAVVKHIWTSADTYASLAFKYYGSIQEPYWRLIYDHNKAIIGHHPNDIRVGLEIEIPPLPDELKKK